MVKKTNIYRIFLLLLACWNLTSSSVTGKAGLHFYTQIKTVTQQWKDFLNNDGESTTVTSQDFPGASASLLGMDFPSNDMSSLALHSRDFSNGDGASLELNARDFTSSDGESLTEHAKDIHGVDGILPSLQTTNGVPWTLNF